MLRHISKVNPSYPVILANALQQDIFGTQASKAGRMLLTSNPNALISCFVEENNDSLKTLFFPLKPSKASCNVYGAVHGGAMWSFSDIASSLHLALVLGKQNNNNNFDFKTINATCRYHNAVQQDQNIVCRSTLVSKVGNTAHFYVDLIPEKFTSLRFDKEKNDWENIVVDGSMTEHNHHHEINLVVPDSTCTRATFTKMF